MSTRPILVVDDDPMVCLFVRRCLEQAGFSATQAGSGAEAIHLVQGGLNPSLIILDLRMPVMDGNELLQRLRELPSTKDVPKLLLSAYLDDLREPVGNDLAMAEKPTPCKELIAVVARMLSGEEADSDVKCSENTP